MAILRVTGGEGGGGWLKIQQIPVGSSVEGKMVAFKTDVPSNNPAYPPQCVLTLNIDGQDTNIGCPTALAMVFKNNEIAPGTMLKITYEGKKKGKRGTEFHSFRTETVEGDTSFPLPAAAPAQTEAEEDADIEAKLAAIRAKKTKAA